MANPQQAAIAAGQTREKIGFMETWGERSPNLHHLARRVHPPFCPPPEVSAFWRADGWPKRWLKMKPVETNGSDVEPAWDEFGIDRRDFRPHWNGDLVNVFSVVDRQESEAETERLMKECARSLARWVIDHRDQFSPEDRFQLIVAWPKTIREFARQTIKIGGTFDELRQIADGDLPFEMRRDWSTGLFSESPREPVTGRQGGASDGDTPSH